MAFNPFLRPRQIWANPTPTSTSLPRHCTPFRLPSGGVVAIGVDTSITLAQEAVFQPYCTASPDINSTTLPFEEKDPFYASTIPLLYAIGAVTVVSYLLVIMLFITPRTFFVGGLGGGGGFLGQRGMFSGAPGSSSVVGVGGRPWLQKAAALSVAISLTIASVDTFRVAELQYNKDYSDAELLTQQVVSTLELRIVRVVSETFLWLAQAQTLIRLFPRHKEKVIIKWAGFVLIGLDTIFSILNNFYSGTTRSAPRQFQDSVPALSYLFTFCLSLVYAAWILYYSLSKRRYAFFHHKMRTICLVALLSLVAVLIPVVFFVLDISIYDVAGWGNYVRWAGAAAASVVVWEWVERIEALERDERKDGILGREIFDGDEMLDVTPSSAITWSSSRGPGGSRGSGGKDDSPSSVNFRGVASVARRFKPKKQASKQRSNQISQAGSSHLGRPPDAAYALQPTQTPPLERSRANRPESQNAESSLHPTMAYSTTPQHSSSDSTSNRDTDKLATFESQNKDRGAKSSVAKSFWDTMQKMPIPFLNRHMSPPIEVKQAVRASQQPEADQTSGTPSGPSKPATYSLLDRIGFRKPASAPKVVLPVTIVPAPPRKGSSWNDVRFHDDISPLSRPLSQNALGRISSSDLPLDRLSRRSIPAASLASNRYSPAPSQGYRLSRGMTPTVTENNGSVQSLGQDANTANKEVSESERCSSTLNTGTGPSQEAFPQHDTVPRNPPPSI